MVNGLIGSFGTREVQVHKRIYLTDITQCMMQLFFNDATVIDLVNGFKECTFITRKKQYSNYIPIYQMILDIEAYEMYLMNSMLLKLGGVISYRNTDNINAIFPKSIDNIYLTT